MLKRFAVGYIDFYNHELTVEIITAETAEDAVVKHSKVGDIFTGDLTLEAMCEEAFNCDCMINVMEIFDETH